MVQLLQMARDAALCATSAKRCVAVDAGTRQFQPAACVAGAPAYSASPAGRAIGALTENRIFVIVGMALWAVRHQVSVRSAVLLTLQRKKMGRVPAGLVLAFMVKLLPIWHGSSKQFVTDSVDESGRSIWCQARSIPSPDPPIPVSVDRSLPDPTRAYVFGGAGSAPKAGNDFSFGRYALGLTHLKRGVVSYG